MIRQHAAWLSKNPSVICVTRTVRYPQRAPSCDRTGNGNCDGMSSNDDCARSKQLIRAFHRRLWAEGDLDVLSEMVAPDAVVHWGDSDSSAVTAIRADVERYFTAFTDVRTFIDELVGEGDKVVLRWKTAGVHTGPYGKVLPTGRRVTMTGVDVYRLDGGRIVEAWSMWDVLSAYRQLGLVDPYVGP